MLECQSASTSMPDKPIAESPERWMTGLSGYTTQAAHRAVGARGERVACLVRAALTLQRVGGGHYALPISDARNGGCARSMKATRGRSERLEAIVNHRN